jgi:hypothetical protein
MMIEDILGQDWSTLHSLLIDVSQLGHFANVPDQATLMSAHN